MVVDIAGVRTALDHVLDPHMNVSINDMGMVREITVGEKGKVTIGIAFPCIGCPAWTMIQQDIKEAVAAVAGVSSVSVEVQWDALWSKSDISPSAVARIRSFGYQIMPMD